VDATGLSTASVAIAAMLAVGAIFVILWLVATSSVGEGPPLETVAEPPRRTTTAARVLFVESNETSATVDCAAAPDGAPLSLRVRAPESVLVGDLSFAVLDDWADDEQVVAIEVEPARRRATFDDGATRLCFELDGYGIAPFVAG
jgi:hypothetical protein